MKNPATDRPFIPPAVDAVPSIESDEFSRFEGEGGPAGPSPERVDIPKRLRRLKRSILVARGNFVADEPRRFGPQDEPSGMPADALVKSIDRQLRSASTASDGFLET